MTFIIPNVTDEEIDLLNKNNIEYHPSDDDINDIKFYGSGMEMIKVLRIMGRIN